MTAFDLRDLIEKDWDSHLFGTKIGLAPQLGWTSYHTLRSRGSAPGFPDRTLWRERVIFAELKREKGVLSDRQRDILSGLAAAGGEVYLWRPSDLDEIAAVLGSRAYFLRSSFGMTGGLKSNVQTGAAMWTPGSLWLPAGCRADNANAAGVAAALEGAA